jgi:signal peptidase
MKIIFRILYYLFFTAVIVVVLALLVSLFPIFGGFKFFIVRSGSMAPAIKTGSVVMVKPETDYKIGDVISFSLDGKNEIPTTHRIKEIKIKNGVQKFVTQGDANNAPDMVEIEKENIIGKVILTVPLAGYLVAVAQKPSGYLALILIPAFVIIGDEISKIIKETRKKRQEKSQPKNKSIPFYIFCLGLGLAELLLPSIRANSFFSATETGRLVIVAGSWSHAKTSGIAIVAQEPTTDSEIDVQIASASTKVTPTEIVSVEIVLEPAAPPAPPAPEIPPAETTVASPSVEVVHD